MGRPPRRVADLPLSDSPGSRRRSLGRWLLGAVLVALVLSSAVGGAATAAPATSTPSAVSPAGSPTDGNGSEPPENGSSVPRIASTVPNPVATQDRGERVTVALPETAPSDEVRLTDGQATVRVPWRDGGRVVLTPDPDVVDADAVGRAGTDVVDADAVRRDGTEGRDTDRGTRVVHASGLALANDGERLELRVANRTVDVLRYGDAPEGERLVVPAPTRSSTRSPAETGDGEVTWVPVGLEPRPVVATGAAPVTAFVLPDAPDPPVSTLRSADRRILLAGYTFGSERVADALVDAERRGVDVRVLVEGGPVGGMTARQARLLDRLAAAGVEVRAVGGERARVEFHHPKYAVVDGRALVLTENWKPAGTGGRDSRGWGVRVDSEAFAAELASVFDHDAGWHDAVPWERFRAGRSFASEPAANGSFAGDRDPERLRAESVRLLTAPGNAGDALAAELDGATRRVAVLQPTLGGPDQRLVRAAVAAARRGVEVRVLLSGAWYVEEENRRLVERLRERSETEDLPIEARLADPGEAFEKVHAKGVVVDGDEVILGSLNWNGESIRRNREVLLRLEGEAVASYYRGVFEADWSDGGGDGGSSRQLPVGVIAAVAGCVVLAILVARRIDFGENVGVGP